MDVLIARLEWLADHAKANKDGKALTPETTLREAAAALRAVREAQTTWEVHVNEEWMAGSDDFNDAMHYAAMYESEGTVTVYRVTRSLMPVGEGEVSDCRRGCEFDTCEEPGAPGCGVRNDD